MNFDLWHLQRIGVLEYQVSSCILSQAVKMQKIKVHGILKHLDFCLGDRKLL